MKRAFSCLLVFLLVPFSLQAKLELSLAADLVYNQGLNEDSDADENLSMRSVEFGVSAPIDHQFSGYVSFASHEQEGAEAVEVHEAYIHNAKLIPNTEFKIGQYFLGVGRLNRFHRHEWSFTRAPKSHRDFFDEEAVFDTGIETRTLLSAKHFVELTLGVTSGYNYGHSDAHEHEEDEEVDHSGEKPHAPTHYMRLSQFIEDSDSAASGMEWGLSYLGRTDAEGEKLHLAGFDFVKKERVGRKLAWLIQSELWFKSLKHSDGDKEEQLGGYFMLEKGHSAQWATGLRLDGLMDLSHEHAGEDKDNAYYGATLQQTYRSSEFFSTRLSAAHEFQRVEGRTRDQDTRLMAQLIFVMGAHPAHDF
jgi:hypothetical protein